MARPNRLLSKVLSTLGQCFVSSQPIFYRPHTQTRIVIFQSLRINIPKLEFSQPCSKKLSRTAFPIRVLRKDDHTGFVQEERLDLPCWTMILAICVVVGESKNLVFLTLHFFNNVGASSILTWVSAACPVHPGSLEKRPSLLQPSFVKPMILVQ